MRSFIAASICIAILSPCVYAGIIRQNVRTLSKSGSTGLIGNVTLSPGAGIALTQAGQDINIAATGGGGGGGGSASSSNVKFTLNDAIVPFVNIDGPHYQAITATMSTVNLSMLNSGLSGYTSLQINQFRGGGLLAASYVTITAASGNPTVAVASLSTPLSLLPGDLVTVDVTITATGSPEAISLEY